MISNVTFRNAIEQASFTIYFISIVDNRMNKKVYYTFKKKLKWKN